MRFRFVPAGEFLMGSRTGETGRDEDEVLHGVVLTRDLWVQESELTQAEWERITGSNPSLLTACGSDCPVERVSWFDAVTFANRLSQQSGLETCYELGRCGGTFASGCPAEMDWCHGDYDCQSVEFRGLDCLGYRLPTEAEWEYAARSGTTDPTWIGPIEVSGLNSAPQLDPIAWYAGNSGVSYRPAWDCEDWHEKQRAASVCGTHPVRQKDPNLWGLHDMLGNVWEWVWDLDGEYPSTRVIDPTGPRVGTDRIRRGCSWANIPRHCRAADRSADLPADRDRNWGFRMVRTAGPPG